MRHLLVLCINLFLLAPAAAVGQTTPAVEPGTRVLVVLARQSRSMWRPPQVLQGTVTAIRADSLTLELDAAAAPVTIAADSVARLYVSRGVPSRLESAVWQGALYGWQGAAYWPMLRDLDRSASGAQDRHVLVGAVVGATIGAVAGALSPREAWQPARKGPAPGEFTLPEPILSPRVALGGGLALVDAGKTSGVGQHVQVTVRLTPRSGFLHSRGEFLYSSGTASGNPFDCERVPDIYCFGRSDRTHQYGLGISAVGDAPYTWGPFQPYGIPLGIGVYHRRTHSSESQGPTTTCFIGGEVVSCPNNPPFETIHFATQRTGMGVNTGGGIRTRVGNANVFVELRAHTVWEAGGYSGSLPITFGVGF